MYTAYVISMNKPDDLIENLKYEYNLKPILIKGVNGKGLTNLEIKNNTLNKLSSLFLPKSIIGCSLAHFKTWKKFLETKEEYCIIFEDDVVFENNFKEQLDIVTRNLPKDFDIIYLGCIGCSEEYKFLKKLNNIKTKINNRHVKIDNIFNKPSFVAGLHSYILSKHGAQKLIHNLEKKIYDHVDIMMFNLYNDNKLNIYSLNNRIAFQTSTYKTTSLNGTNFPYVINRFLDMFYVDKMVNANYCAKLSIFRIFNFNVNFITIVFLILGIIFAYLRIDILLITIFFLILVSLDILYLKNLDLIIIYYLIIIIPSILIRRK